MNDIGKGERPLAPTLTDTHCHLNFSAFANDLTEVLARAQEAGVTRFLIPAIDLATSREAIALAEQYPSVYAAVGIHPNSVPSEAWESVANELRALAAHPKVVAIGEIGIDYHWDSTPRDRQALFFQAQLRLAAELALPVIIHSRDAHEDTLASLRAVREEFPSLRGVFHSFGGNWEQAQQVLQEGFFIGITGPVTFSKAAELHRVAQQTPSFSLLIETDSPYLSPSPVRGKRNEPSHVAHIAQRIANLRDIPIEMLANMTTDNARTLFGW